VAESDNEESERAGNGVLWWKLTKVPGTKRPFGQEKRLAAWLWFRYEVGAFFTMKDARAALGADLPEDAEHLNRRLRALRPDGWVIVSYKDDRNLPVDTYRLDTKGTRVWLGERKPRQLVSAATRRHVLDRDGNRCQVCGIGSGESYPSEPDTHAKMTVGHRVPQDRGGTNDPDNLRTECSRCNEPVRHEVADPETYNEVFAVVRKLKNEDLKSLVTWLQSGERSRSKLDTAYDRARQLSESERLKMVEAIKNMIK
jgi:5-methylcytosine-specific restriction endonuclease McrA